MIKKIIRGIPFLVTFLSMTACQTLFSFSPDRAAIQEIVLNSPSTMEVHRDTIRVLPMQEFEAGMMVLATYLGTSEGGQMSECLALFQTEKGVEGWNAFSHGSGCWPAGLLDEDPVQILYGQRSSNGQSTSDASGLVYLPEITSVEVTWGDGESQSLEVVKGSFLGLRSGSHELKSITAFDEFATPVYSYVVPSPTPGKGTP
jgi:hypothetical protein